MDLVSISAYMLFLHHDPILLLRTMVNAPNLVVCVTRWSQQYWSRSRVMFGLVIKINEAWSHQMDLRYSLILGLDFQDQLSVLFVSELLFFLYYFGILTLKQM